MTPLTADGRLHSLQREMLALVCRAEDTPLRFGIDSAGIASMALARNPAGPGEERSLAAWIELRHRVWRDIHPRVFTMVALQLDGLSARDLADNLGLGLNLVRTVLAEAQRAVEAADP